MGASPSHPSAPREGPSGDTAFMEQVLRELSAQNEHAREEGSRARPTAPAPDAGPPRPRTVRVPRDSEFRTPEGVPSARAYLPARTLAPGRKEPIDPDRVHVADPRKLPTVRISRDRRDASRKDPPASGADGDPSSSPVPELDWGSPVAEETAPTLRSASPLVASPRRPETRRWIGWVLIAAVAGVLLVALAARFRASTERSSSPAASPPDRRAASLRVSTAPSPRPAVSASPSHAVLTSAPPASSSPPPPPAVTRTGTPEPAAPPRAAPKSDRWY